MIEIVISVLFIVGFVGFFGLYLWEKWRNLELKRKYTMDIIEARKDAVKRSRSAIEGLVFEQLVPHFPEWKYGKPSDARFISSPLDYVVFSGLSEDDIKEIIFVEIKTGSSQTTKRQRSVRDAIKEGRIRYDLLDIEKCK